MSPCKRVLVLYTGGTIGMQQSAAGLVPVAGFASRLREQQARQPELQLPAWQLHELLPPIDSANMTQAHWLTMVEAIRAGVEQDGCDGVLVLHGTDTLAYSAAALSFLLLGLEVPVLLTGAMLPAGTPGSDAWDNLFGALQALGAGLAAGVQLYFHGRLLHGARASKLNTASLDAFGELPRLREGLRAEERPAALDYRRPRQPVNLAVLPLYPGIQAAHLGGLLDTGVQALLLECYGSGTGPAADPTFIEALRCAHRRGVVLAAISQCPSGHVDFGIYAAGSGLRDAGVVSGGGMTREAALGKLFAVLAAGLEQAQVEYWFSRDLCGELAAD